MWHSEDINTILKRLESRLSGLSSKEAEERIKKYGYNEIYIPKRFRRLKIFLRQFESILVWMLIISTVVSFAIGEVNDAIAIAVIVALNATLGFIQEYRAEKAVEALKRMAAPKARVLRDGKEVVVPAREVVPGDILLLQAGDKVPADIRLIESMNLR
ncbi:MAG: ATPase, partial [Thermoprotei archaeon]